MKFDIYFPCDSLKPFIRSLVISENPDESSYKILPDTGVVIGFQYKGKLSVLNSNKAKIHQNGGSDYLTFTKQCASAGIEKWIVSIKEMTCIYYNLAGNEILAETIPTV